MLSIVDLPREHGVPLGRYRLRRDGCNEAFPGVRYVDGVSVEPVDGKAVARQAAAFGGAVIIEPWDEETGKLVVTHLLHVKKGKLASEVQALFGGPTSETVREMPAVVSEPEEDVEEVDEEDEVNFDAMSKAELQQLADELEIHYGSRDTKPQLIGMIEEVYPGEVDDD